MNPEALTSADREQAQAAMMRIHRARRDRATWDANFRREAGLVKLRPSAVQGTRRTAKTTAVIGSVSGSALPSGRE